MTGIRVRCLDHRGQTEHLGTVLGVTQSGNDTLVVVLCDDGEARVFHHKRIRAEQTQPQNPSMLQPITPLTMIGPGLWERPDPPLKHTKFDALVNRWEQDEQRRPELKRARRWVDESLRVDHAEALERLL